MSESVITFVARGIIRQTGGRLVVVAAGSAALGLAGCGAFDWPTSEDVARDFRAEAYKLSNCQVQPLVFDVVPDFGGVMARPPVDQIKYQVRFGLFVRGDMPGGPSIHNVRPPFKKNSFFRNGLATLAYVKRNGRWTLVNKEVDKAPVLEPRAPGEFALTEPRCDLVK